MTTPNDMPQKANPLHTQILGELLTVRTTTRPEVRVKNVKRGKDGVYRHDLVGVDVPVPTLAGNVSNDNVERAAKRWIR